MVEPRLESFCHHQELTQIAMSPLIDQTSPPVPLGRHAHVYSGVPTRAVAKGGSSGAMRVLSVRSLVGSNIHPEWLVDVAAVSRNPEKYTAKAGDVVIPSRSTSFTAAVVPRELDGVVINATLIGIRCSDRLNPRLLAAYLRHPQGRAAVEEWRQSGTAQLNVTVNALNHLLVPLPSRETQEQLVRVLDAAEMAYDVAIHAAERRMHVANEIMIQAMTAA